MLIEFSVGNYKSFKETVTFSMVAANLAAENKRLDQDNVFSIDNDLRLLKSTAIYGGNASGKSNLISAINFMKKFVLNSSKDTQIDEGIPVEPFRLSTETTEAPSHFEIVFLMDGRKYRYGFEVDSHKVFEEWLYHVPTIREAKLFDRHEDQIKVTPVFKEGQDIKTKTRGNALFLSAVAQWNGQLAAKIVQWFKDMEIVSGLSDSNLRNFTAKALEDPEISKQVLRFVKGLDVGIDDIRIQRRDLRDTSSTPEDWKVLMSEIIKIADRLNADLKTPDVKTYHRKFDADKKPISDEVFDIDANESEGTRKIFALAGPIVDVLNTGKVLFIDEFDARLHPLITHEIVKLFNSPESNPRNAQLIVVTHDTNLLSKDLFRRDQVWFAEKDIYGATHMYSLAEYKERNDASFETNYIKGKYGAIPYIGDLSRLLGANHG